MTQPVTRTLAQPCTCGVSDNIGRDAALRHACYAIKGNMPAETRSGEVYTIDPSLPRLDGAISPLAIPREPLRPGPRGRLFAVESFDQISMSTRARVNLDRRGAFKFDQGDPESHCRNAYFAAMATYETFRRALGRPVAWAFWTEDSHPPLRLRPFGFEGLNAWYDRDSYMVEFGYARLGPGSSRADASLQRFTALSSDVVVHEVTHALIDGLRPGYLDTPAHPDVLAFHEALPDVVALLARFERSAYLRTLVERSGIDFLGGKSLVSLAPELGRAVRKLGLRTLDVAWTGGDPDDAELRLYPDAGDEPHERGGLLSSAVFEAFLDVLDRRIRPLIRLVPPNGSATERYLRDQVVEISARTASHFLAICIRALDYCPPAGIRFGDYLRALITADRILASEDRYGYRDAFIASFRRRGLYPADIDVVSESELVWDEPTCPVYPIPGLALVDLRYESSPAMPFDAREIRRQAKALAYAITDDPLLFRELGLRPAGQDRESGDVFTDPEVVSIRPTLRIGPDGYLDASIIAEVVQERRVTIEGGTVPLRGGGTLILDASGTPAFVVRQRIDNPERRAAEVAFARTAIAAERLALDGGVWRLSAGYRRQLC